MNFSTYRTQAQSVFSNATLPCCFALLALCVSCTAMARSVVSAEVVGEVSFVVGEAYVENQVQGALQAKVVVGDNVFEGDRIETASSGHVHIRFVDGGLVSIRPRSMFDIQAYQYDVLAPSDSMIKFELSEGVVRSISGAGAKAARDKFRLNTPIAAIGVRGTDFIVKASVSKMQAVVNEGAIVVAPFSSSCLSESLGPCSSNAVELDDVSQFLVELSSLSSKPRLVPLSERLDPELIKEPSSNAKGDNAEEPDAANKSDGESSDETSSNENLNQDKESVGYVAPVDETKRSVDRLDAIVKDDATLGKSNYVPEKQVDLPRLSERRLVWGRWSNELKDTDRIVAARKDLLDGRSATVGNQEYILYRADQDLSIIDADLRSVEFGLVDAQATLTSAYSTELMEVKGGRLNINFVKGTFETALELNHYLTSDLGLSFSGKIDKKGFFNSRDDSSRLLGATTLDGKEASYLFYKDTDFGRVDGVTYWNNK